MNCSEAREIIQNILDGNMDSDCIQVNEHIAGCAECRKWKAEMESVVRIMGADEHPSDEIDISMYVMSALPARHPAAIMHKSISRSLVWILGCWFIGLLLLAGGLWLLAYLAGVGSAGVLSGTQSILKHLLQEMLEQADVIRTLWSTAAVLAAQIVDVVWALKWILLKILMVNIIILAGAYTAGKRKWFAVPVEMV